jgi:hypothetical protein
MTWRSSTPSPSDRFWSCLPYVLPLIEVLGFSVPFFMQFPALSVLFLPLVPFLQVYSLVNRLIPFGLGSLVIFLAIYFLVVRNDQISHFIRYNAMMSIIIGIILSLSGLLLSPLAMVPGTGFLGQVLFTTVFLGTVGLVGFCVVQTIRGLYAEIPTLSDAAKIQIY